MDSALSADQTVEQVLAAHPGVSSVFLQLDTYCIGCYMERFCTLEEVASAYELRLEVLLGKLQECIEFSSQEEEV